MLHSLFQQRCVVTGANGFLGAHLVCHLLQQGAQVVAIRRPGASMAEFNFIHSLYPNLLQPVWADGFLWDSAFTETILQPGDRVFHCAGLVSFQQRDYNKLLQVNRDLTSAMVNACLGLEGLKFIHVSSTSALSRANGNTVVNEDLAWDPSAPHSVYGKSKYLAELQVWRGIEEGLNAAIINPGIIDGPGDFAKGSSTVYRRFAKGSRYTAPGASGYVSVHDVCKAMMQLAGSDVCAERFLLISENLSFQNYFELICANLGVKPPSVFVPKGLSLFAGRWMERLLPLIGIRPFVTRDIAKSAHQINEYDGSKIKRFLPDFSYTPIADAVEETAKAYRKWEALQR